MYFLWKVWYNSYIFDNNKQRKDFEKIEILIVTLVYILLSAP